MANFAPIRDVPLTGLSEWEASVLNSLKENVEVLIGVRQSGVRAVMNDSVTVDLLGLQLLRQVSAQGAYYTITVGPSTVDVPTKDDYVKLITDVQALANDLAETRSKLDVLIGQLKG